jgi:hypothetical protein
LAGKVRTPDGLDRTMRVELPSELHERPSATGCSLKIQRFRLGGEI